MKDAGVHGKLSLIKNCILRNSLIDEQQGSNDPDLESQDSIIQEISSSSDKVAPSQNQTNE